MKKLLYLLLISLIVISCDKSENCCTIVDTHVDIRFVDANGDNILDQTNGIESSKITIFNKIENFWVEYSEGNLDNPKGYMVYEKDGENYLRLFPNGEITTNNLSETKIQYSIFEPDVLKSEIDLSNGNIICTKVWLNEVLIWEGNDSERVIQIEK